jgi:hypothetical protein
MIRQLFIVFATLPLVILNYLFLSRLTPKPFEDRNVQFPSSYMLIDFSDLHRTLLKCGRKQLAAFQKSFMKIREMWRPLGTKGKLKRE